MNKLIDQLEAAHKKVRDFSDAVQDEINRKTGFCFYCTLHTHYDETRFSIHHCEAETNDPDEEGFEQYASYSCEAIRQKDGSFKFNNRRHEQIPNDVFDIVKDVFRRKIEEQSND